MAWYIQTISLIIGTFIVIAENRGIAQYGRAKRDRQSDNEGTTCSGFPSGLSHDPNVVIGWSSRWKNQCPKGTMVRGLWAPNSNTTIQDMKCCKAPVDQVLSEMIFDTLNQKKKSSGVNETWKAQCSDNHVITGIKIADDLQTVGGTKMSRIAGMKCSSLIDKQIVYRKCKRLDFTRNNGKTRDPLKSWSHECPKGMAMVGLYGNQVFSVIRYGKCCSVKDTQSLVELPVTCKVGPNDMCGWSLSRNSSVPWEFKRLPGGKGYALLLKTGKSSGSAKLTSPGFSFPRNQICFRLNYRLFMQAVIRVYKKSYNPQDRVAIVKEVMFLAENKLTSSFKDVKLDISSNFQIMIEVERLKIPISNALVESFVFLEADQCQADECNPKIGCANGKCMPSGPNGFMKCECLQGYQKVNGECKNTLPPTNTAVTTKIAPVTTHFISVRLPTTEGGNHRGGDTNKDTGTSKSKQKLSTINTGIDPWMYTVIGAICGTLMVLFLVFSFLTYRRRRLTRRTYQFNFDVNYLRTRSFSGSFVSENNNSYVMEPTSPAYETEIKRSTDIEMHPVPRIELPEDQSSTHTGTPPSHHYFEVEPESEIERKTSQITLVSPVYGSNEDVSEHCQDQEIFMEPPNDEKELCAQLDREIDWKELTILHEKQLGQGAFGYVHYGIWQTDDGNRKSVAIKSMKDSNSAEERIKFLQEAAIMKQFAHQNVMFMFGVITKRYPPMIILEYMKNGNLRKYLRREKKSRIKKCLQRTDYDLHRTFLKMAREIAAGMTYLSGMQFVHRDLAARNILLDENMVCKIGDFGLARDLIGCQHYISQGGQIPVKWTAPEALSFRRYSGASDVWSFGVLLFEIWSIGRKPYEGWSNDDVIEHVCNKGYRMPPPKECPRVIYHLMIDCWHPEESKRPRFSQVKFCLAQKDERLLGRKMEGRQRSVTLNEIQQSTIPEDSYRELQYVYCKTE